MEANTLCSVRQGFAGRQPTERTAIFVGHARLPQSLAGSHASPVVSLELQADMDRGIILNAAAKGVPPLGGRLLSEVLAGRNLKDGPQEAADEILRRYVCPSHKALATAVINAYEAYYRYQQQGCDGRQD